MFKPIPTRPGELQRVTTIAHPTPLYETQLSALGQPLLFQTNHAPFLAAAEDTFARFPAPRAAVAPLVVQVMVRDGAASAAVSPPRSHPGLVVQNQRHLVSLTVGGENTAVADMNAGFAFAVLSPQMAQDVPFVRYTFIEALPQILLSGRGFVAVHAACVVKDGVSLMLCAPAGTGKSTLAFTCLQHGYQILAEDVVHVHLAEDGGIRLWGIPWKFHLLPDSLRFFPELADAYPQMQTNGEWKIEVELDLVYPGSTITDAPAGKVVFLERDAAQPACLEKLSAAEARRSFEVIWSWDLPWPARYEAPLADLLATGAYRLRMDGSPHEAVALLEGLVTGAAT